MKYDIKSNNRIIIHGTTDCPYFYCPACSIFDAKLYIEEGKRYCRKYAAVAVNGICKDAILPNQRITCLKTLPPMFKENCTKC